MDSGCVVSKISIQIIMCVCVCVCVCVWGGGGGGGGLVIYDRARSQPMREYVTFVMYFLIGWDLAK